MSNTKRKARKRNGEKFERTEKVGTPIALRSIPDVRKIVKGVVTIAPSNSARRRRDRQLDVLAQHESD